MNTYHLKRHMQSNYLPQLAWEAFRGRFSSSRPPSKLAAARSAAPPRRLTVADQVVDGLALAEPLFGPWRSS